MPPPGDHPAWRGPTVVPSTHPRPQTTGSRPEIFTAAYGERTGARVVHGVGGSFDIQAGVTRRAPVPWQRWGVEWLYRALQEPRRLGRRYLTTNAAFVLMTAREFIRLTPSPASANRSH
ncbi:WecB/TagA/CpsF family glycosyltransferase [Streptomyces sp. SAS_269]|uniref:WecB/TagA/CpsF family glycosyltransferase n=1 Tax=Streptomyces sp. SAS_269 TaxID=3412749 RepID=UPI00403CBD08